MEFYRAELHVHTVLSPCAEIEMIPPLIVAEALEKGINLIAVTDHNASANVAAVQKAALTSGITVLPGIEVQTQEEVHVICLFDQLDQLEAWQRRIDRQLPPVENNPEFFGEQFIVDETGDFLRRENRLLLISADLSLEETFQGVRELGGLAIPAHVDRKVFGLIANLGFVPSNLEVDALEVSRNYKPENAQRELAQLKNYPLIQSGDVHRLDEFLGANEFFLNAPTVSEIRLALHNQEGRWHKLRSFSPRRQS